MDKFYSDLFEDSKDVWKFFIELFTENEIFFYFFLRVKLGFVKVGFVFGGA